MAAIEDFIPVYPRMDDPHIQSIITSKQEFREVAATAFEATPEKGKLYKHQQFFVRLMRMSDRVLNIQEPGTGKTCAFFGVTEYYRSRGEYERVFILERGPNLLEEVRNQLIYRCTAGQYIPTARTTDRGRRVRITRSLSDWYDFQTYGSFANALREMSDDEIIARYSRCIFIFDEAHNIANGGLDASMYIDDDDEDDNGRSHKENKKIYEQIYRLTRLIRNSKIAVITATPMINRVEEIVPLVNLLITPDQEPMPSPSNDRYKTISLEELEPYIRGKVTFVRALESSAHPLYMGMSLPGTFVAKTREGQVQVEHQTIIYPVEMGDLQAQAYRHYIHNPGAFSRNLIQSATFSFPNGEIGGSIKAKPDANATGLTRYVEGTITRSYNWQLTPDPVFMAWPYRGEHVNFASWLYNNGDTSNLARLSQIFRYIVEIERVDRPVDVGGVVYPYGRPGCAFIYIESLAGGGGILLILILQLFGFALFSDYNAMVGDAANRTRRIAPGLAKRPRVALITSELPLAQQAAILELFNSDENVDGEYIKILIGSKVTRDGISVYHCMRAHMVIPSWHSSGMIQAINRVLRASGHDAWKKKRIAEAVTMGMTEAEAAARLDIKVEIYRYSAFTTDERGQRVSIHENMYKTAEEKEYYNRRIFRMLKICAVDAQLNRARNFLPASKNWTIECDYSTCEYEPFDPLPEDAPVDYSTYDIMYSDEIVEEVLHKIVEIVSQSGHARIETLYDMLPTYRRLFIDRAIGRLAEEKVPTTNAFGLVSYVATDGELVYTQREYPVDRYPDGAMLHKDISIYSRNIVGVLIRNLDEDLRPSIDMGPIYESLDEIVDAARVLVQQMISSGQVPAEIAQYPAEQQFEYMFQGQLQAQIRTYLASLPYEARIKVAEEMIERISDPATPNHPADVAIYERFKYYISRVSEPVDKIRKVNKNYPAKTPDVVWIHSLDILRFGITSHATTSDFLNRKNVKIYNPNERLGWRNPLSYERVAYLDLMNESVKEMLAPFERKLAYGTLYQDGKFRIRDRRAENEGAMFDRRREKRGFECIAAPYKSIVLIAYEEGIDRHEYQQWVHAAARQDPMIGNKAALLNYITVECSLNNRDDIAVTFTDDQVHYFYFIVLKVKSQGQGGEKVKAYLCNSLFNHFLSTGALLDA